jgi:hypothetical protein
MTLQIHVLACDWHKNVVVLNQLIGGQSSTTDTLFSIDNTDIKKVIKKKCTDSFPLKSTTLSEK